MSVNIIISIIISISLCSFTVAEEKDLLIQGVKSYKEGNYLGTVQLMEEVIEENPGSALAYYYTAISYVMLGDTAKARESYDKVIVLSPGSQLARYSEIGKRLMETKPVKNDEKTIEKDEITSDFYEEKVEKDMKERNLKFIIEKINRDKKISPEEYQKFEDFSPDKSMERPNNEEIQKAMQVLMQAGISPGMPAGIDTGVMNPQLMQMSMLTGGMSGQQNNNPMNMLPMLMMMQGQNNGSTQDNYNPQFIQSMLNNMMMPNMMDFSDKRDY